MRIAQGIEMLEISTNMGESQSFIYPTLIWDDKDVVLIDTGFPGQMEQFREVISEAGVPFEQVNHIIITHQDIDHVGALAAIVKELNGGVEVIAHEEEKPYITGEQTPIKLAQLEDHKDSQSEDKRGFYEMLKRGFALTKTQVDNTVVNGELLPYCGGIRVIHTPGHTPGHISLYHVPSKTLITGDAMNIQGEHLAGPNPAYTYDMKQAWSSMEEYTKLDVEHIVSYHCGCYTDHANEAIKTLLQQPQE